MYCDLSNNKFDLRMHLPCTEDPPFFSTEYCSFAGSEHGTYDAPISYAWIEGLNFNGI